MGVCQMERVVRQARAEEARARAATRRAVSGELRRLVGLADPATAGDAAVDTAAARPSVACRLYARLGAWLAPDTALAGQTPASRPNAFPPRAPQRKGPAPGAAVDTVIASPPLLPGDVSAAPRRAIVTSTPRPAEEEHRVRAARQRAAMYLVEIHKKLAIAAACFVFTLVGVPIALRFPRGGIGLVIGVSLAIFTVYYVGLIGGEELGDRLIVSPFVSMWIPNIAFTLVGVAGWLLVRRETGTARGGDWADLKDLLRPLMRRWA
jgi:lipopolysaccharide export system permease protein